MIFLEPIWSYFGGTALVPDLHDGLSDLLDNPKEKDVLRWSIQCMISATNLTIRESDGHLGQGRNSYTHIDLLIMDREEALHLSGMKDLSQAGKFFMEKGVASFIITNGTEDTWCYSDGSFFRSLSR